jgi:hypothetical protein
VVALGVARFGQCRRSRCHRRDARMDYADGRQSGTRGSSHAAVPMHLGVADALETGGRAGDSGDGDRLPYLAGPTGRSTQAGEHTAICNLLSIDIDCKELAGIPLV